MSDIVIFEVENTFSVLNYSRCVRRDEELDGLREAVFRYESAGLGTKDLGVCGGDSEASQRVGLNWTAILSI